MIELRSGATEHLQDGDLTPFDRVGQRRSGRIGRSQHVTQEQVDGFLFGSLFVGAFLLLERLCLRSGGANRLRRANCRAEHEHHDDNRRRGKRSLVAMGRFLEPIKVAWGPCCNRFAD